MPRPYEAAVASNWQNEPEQESARWTDWPNEPDVPDFGRTNPRGTSDSRGEACLALRAARSRRIGRTNPSGSTRLAQYPGAFRGIVPAPGYATMPQRPIGPRLSRGLIGA